MKRIPQLDGIRGLAILLVLIWHYYVELPKTGTEFIPTIIKLGLSLSWSGVDLFFVLSGFLIGGILLDNKSSGNLFSTFYYRRFFRIIPLYSFFIIFFFVVYFADTWHAQKGFEWLMKSKNVQNPVPLWSYATFMQNFFMANSEDFGPKWLGISWSLAIEEQFYLIIPFLVKKTSDKWLFYLSIFCIVFSILCRSLFTLRLESMYASFVLLPARMDSLMFGLLAAWMVRQPHILKKLQDKHWALSIFAIISGSGLLYLSSVESPPGKLFLIFGFTWIAAFYTAIILLTVANKDNLLNKFLCNSVLRGLGFISYFAYLFHLMFLGLCHSLILKHSPQNMNLLDYGVTIIALILTLGVGTLSLRFFEKPLLNFGHKLKY